jgi:hypothetical protein
MLAAMRKLGLVVIALAGCYGNVGVGVHSTVRVNPVAAVATAVAVAAVVNAVATAPPMAVNVEYYDAGYRPGHCWVNGRYTYVNSNWAWQPGYWQDDRPGYVWVQGAWTQQGNQYVWVDGYWAEPRAGYVYIDGYYDYRDTGYAWVPGRWEVERPGYVFVGGTWTTSGGGHRVWQQGRWERDDGRAEWTRYRRTTVVRDHRR